MNKKIERIRARLLREITTDSFTTVTAEYDNDGPEGYFDSGDAADDAATCAAIRAGADSGNEWAWCIAKVETDWRGLIAIEYLGGCTYANEADFKAGGYYADMLDTTHETLTEMALQIVATYTDIVESLDNAV